jgi:hypothetical protein
MTKYTITLNTAEEEAIFMADKIAVVVEEV